MSSCVGDPVSNSSQFSYQSPPQEPPLHHFILITTMTHCNCEARFPFTACSEMSKHHWAFSLRHIFPPSNGKFKYHISAECNIHLARDKALAWCVSCIRFRIGTAQSLTPDLTVKLVVYKFRAKLVRNLFVLYWRACVGPLVYLRESRFQGICACPGAPPVSLHQHHPFSFLLAF